jgi:hypothetical protein
MAPAKQTTTKPADLVSKEPVQTGAESEDQTSQNATQTTDESVVKT